MKECNVPLMNMNLHQLVLCGMVIMLGNRGSRNRDSLKSLDRGIVERDPDAE